MQRSWSSKRSAGASPAESSPAWSRGTRSLTAKGTCRSRATGSRSFPVIAAVGAFGIADAHGGSGFIAAFVGGVVFGWVAGRDASAAAFSEELGSVLNGVTLILFGAAVLGSLWSDIGLVEVVYALLSLTVVRMVPVAIAMLGTHARAPTVLFLGWFGPRGLASIVFGVVVVESRRPAPHVSTVVALTATVAMSVVAHGVTAAPFATAICRVACRVRRTDGERARTRPTVAPHRADDARRSTTLRPVLRVRRGAIVSQHADARSPARIGPWTLGSTARSGLNVHSRTSRRNSAPARRTCRVFFRAHDADTGGVAMADTDIDELGPVDYLVIEFPGSKFNGEIAPTLIDLRRSRDHPCP